jgi:pimeloyl-ACP methyl ester carboxylesterase
VPARCATASPAIVGHDFGGTTVLRAHLLDGRDFAKVVLIDPVAVGPWGSPFFNHARRHREAFVLAQAIEAFLLSTA